MYLADSVHFKGWHVYTTEQLLIVIRQADIFHVIYAIALCISFLK